MTARTPWLGPVLALAAIAAVTSLPAVPRAQSVTGVSPNWGDLQPFTRSITASREVEHGLGLHFSGPDGVMMVSFAGRLSLRTMAAPASLSVVMAPPVMTNPNLIRKPTLVFVADDKTGDREVVDASGSVRVDDPAPGATVRSATGRIGAGDFVRLSKAKTLTAEVFGSMTTVRPEQIEAMKALADKLRLQ